MSPRGRPTQSAPHMVPSQNTTLNINKNITCIVHSMIVNIHLFFRIFLLFESKEIISQSKIHYMQSEKQETDKNLLSVQKMGGVLLSAAK